MAFSCSALGERASAGCISPTTIASLFLARASPKIAPLRSPLSSGEGFLFASVWFGYPKKNGHHEPSPPERGDRSGREFRGVREMTDAVAVGEIYHLAAPSPFLTKNAGICSKSNIFLLYFSAPWGFFQWPPHSQNKQRKHHVSHNAQRDRGRNGKKRGQNPCENLHPSGLLRFGKRKSG